MTDDKPITRESIPHMTDDELNSIILSFSKRGRWGWAVSLAEEEIARRRGAREPRT